MEPAAGPVGPRPTMADVAQAVGLSRALVSIVMRDVPGASDETRRRVLAAAAEMGYVPDARARKLRQARSRLLGVTFDLRQPFHAALVEHLYPAAEAHGYDLVLSAVAPSRTESQAVEVLRRERCDAALLLGTRMPTSALVALHAQLPTVTVTRDPGTGAVPSVRTDDEHGVGLAVDHLVALGHRAITHVDGGDASSAEERRRGFVARMSARGLGATATVLPGGDAEADGARAATAALDLPLRPTAIIAFNDRCARGVLDTLHHRGLVVPHDVSVVGYDDSPLAVAHHLQLTTVSQDAAVLARSAVEAAIGLIEGGAARSVVHPPTFVVRGTTGPVGA